MTTETKKSTWISVGLVSLIFTGFGIAFTAGKWTSVSGHEIEKTNERVRDIQVYSEYTRAKLNNHSEQQLRDMKLLNQHLHNMELQLREQTVILKQMKGN